MTSQMDQEQPQTASPQLEIAQHNLTDVEDPTKNHSIKGKIQDKAESLRFRLLRIVTWFDVKFKDLTFSQYCYFFASLMLIAFLSDEQPNDDYQVVVGLIAGLGLLRELWMVFNKIWEHTLGKAFLLVLYAATANFALAISALKINSIAGVEPQIFIFTMGFTTLLMLPFWLLGASLVFLGSAVLVINLWLLISFVLRIFRIKLKIHWEDKSFAVLTMLMRMLLIPFLMTVLAHLINPYLKQMDMLDHFREATLMDKIDPILIDPVVFEGRSEQEMTEFLTLVREADMDNLSAEEATAIQEYELSQFQLDVIRELPDKSLNRLVERLNQASAKDVTASVPRLPKANLESGISDNSEKQSASVPETDTQSKDTSAQETTFNINFGLVDDDAGTEDKDLQVLNLMVSNFLYLFETYRYTACAKQPHQRGLQLDENMIFIAERDATTDLGFRFFVTECVPDKTVR